MMRIDERARLTDAVLGEIERHRVAAAMGDTGAAWWALERAHILSQSALPLHMRVHRKMLGYALRTSDPVEAVGQMVRLALAPLGQLTGRIPVGNTGRARVSAFASMPIPADLRTVVDAAVEQ